MLSAVVAALVGAAIAGLALLLPQGVLAAPLSLAAPIVSAALAWRLLPAIARKAAKAEWGSGVLVLMYTRDDKLYPIAARYVPSKDVVEPIDEARGKIVFFTEPGSTVSVHGHKLKVAFTYVDHPVLISPKYAAVVYDMKHRYELEDLGVALDVEDAAEGRRDKLERELEYYQELSKLLEEAASEEARRKLAALLNVDPSALDERYLSELRDAVEKRLKTIELALAKAREKPVVLLGGRFWTPRDLLGYIGFRVRAVDLRMIRELARLEVLERTRSALREWAPVFLAVFLGIILLAAIALIFGYVPKPAQGAAALPQVMLNVTNTTG